MNEAHEGLEGKVSTDPKAFERLYEINYRRIFNYVLYSTGDIETSLDITSETFLKAMAALDRYESRGVPFSAWLYRIASREIAMHFRRLSRAKMRGFEQAVFSEETIEARRGVAYAEIAEAGARIESCEEYLVLAPLLQRLPMRYREVVFLRFFEDWSMEDIASFLHRPKGTVKAQCHRGLRLLRRWMQPSQASMHYHERISIVPDGHNLREEFTEDTDA